MKAKFLAVISAALVAVPTAPRAQMVNLPTSKQILGSGATIPPAAGKLIAELNKYSPREKK